MNDLRLLDMPMPVLRALLDGDVDVARSLLGVEIPEEFAGRTDIWHFMVDLLNRRPANAGWSMQALVRSDEIVGHAGFKGAPDDHGEVELGYGVLPVHRRHGLALAAVGLLLERAARQPSVSRVLATIEPDNIASVGVVRKAGFRPDGEHVHERWGRQLRFMYALPDISR